MPTNIPYSFSRINTTKIPAREGWVYVKPVQGRFAVSGSGFRTEYADERTVRGLVVELVNALGGPVPYMPGPLPRDYESAKKIVSSLLEDEEDFDPKGFLKHSLPSPASNTKAFQEQLAAQLLEAGWVLVRVNADDDGRWIVDAEVIDEGHRRHWAALGARVAPEPEEGMIRAQVVRQFKVACKRMLVEPQDIRFEDLRPAHHGYDLQSQYDDLEDIPGDWRIQLSFYYEPGDKVVAHD